MIFQHAVFVKFKLAFYLKAKFYILFKQTKKL